ncbi:hypothetical protein [Sporosarcina sp. FSL K6-3457]
MESFELRHTAVGSPGFLPEPTAISRMLFTGRPFHPILNTSALFVVHR